MSSRTGLTFGFRDVSAPGDQRTSTDRATVKTIMDRNDGIGPGFDSLRLWLALAVLLIHSVAVAEFDRGLPQAMWNGPLRPILLAVLPMFFGLSGFLVAGSAMRTRSVKAFLALRLLRLLPALSVEITLSALVLGPLLTVVPLWLYFTDPLFLSYFGNIIGLVQFYLPGLFATTPVAGVVNLNLWTLHAEYLCYAFMLILMMSGALFDRRTTTIIICAGLGLLGFGNSLFGLGETADMYDTPVLLMSFIMGVVAYQWRERIPVHVGLFAAAVVALYCAWSVRGAALLGLIPLDILHGLSRRAAAATTQAAAAGRLFVWHLPVWLSNPAGAGVALSRAEGLVAAVSGRNAGGAGFRDGILARRGATGSGAQAARRGRTRVAPCPLANPPIPQASSGTATATSHRACGRFRTGAVSPA